MSIPSFISVQPSQVIRKSFNIAYKLATGPKISSGEVGYQHYAALSKSMRTLTQKVTLLSQRVLLALVPFLAAHLLGFNAGALALGAVGVLSMPSLALSAGSCAFLCGVAAALSSGAASTIGCGLVIAATGLAIMELHEKAAFGLGEYQMQKNGLDFTRWLLN